MTLPLSRPKARSILRQFFNGVPQTVISAKVGANQSTVSLYATRFGERAASIGLVSAAEEYGMNNQILELRSLAVELQQAKMTTEEARAGVKIIKAFSKLGVPPDRHQELVKACKEITEDGFIKTALDFLKLNEKTGLTYDALVTKYEGIVAQLGAKGQQLANLQAECNSTEKLLARKKTELNNLDEQVAEVRKAASAKIKVEEDKLKASLVSANMKLEAVQQVAKIKNQLESAGWDISTFVKAAMEYTK